MTENSKYQNYIYDEEMDRLRRHFHVNCYFGVDEEMEQDDLFHEGIAYDNEEHWALFYDDGVLKEIPVLKNNDYFIMNVYKKDISNLDKDIFELFEKWVQQKLKEIPF